MTAWGFKPIFDSYLVVALLTAGMLLLLSVRPRLQHAAGRRSRILLALRVALILLVALAMLRPTRINSVREPQKAVLLVLFDKTRSMSLPDAAGKKSRWDAQQGALERIMPFLKDPGQQLEIKTYAYDSDLHAIEPSAIATAQPEGDQTDIGSNLYEAVKRELGKRVLGVLLLGDGAQTAFVPRIELQQAARELQRLDYPLNTVTFGPTGDAVQARDIAMENLPERYTVFVKNELPIVGSLRVRGYVNREVPVELIIDGPAGERQVLGPVRVTAREDDELVPVAMDFTPQKPGEYKLTLRAAEQPGELVTRNNELSAFLTVLEGGLRVLYLHGDLLGEQRVLRRSIAASPDIQLDSVFVDPRNRENWPLSLDDELKPPKFDVLLVENIDSSAFGQKNLNSIVAAISAGKGFMMIGGYHSFGAGGYQGTPLADALPVRMGRFERQDVSPESTVVRDLHIWDEIAMQPARSHPVTRLASATDNLQVWSTLPALQGANRVLVKPSGQVLLESPEGVPLLVAGQYGRGRVLAFAGNTTTRWWQYGRQREHRRFWRQVVLWLAARQELNKSDVWIKLPQRRFYPGAEITFEGGAKSAFGDALVDAQYTAELVDSEGKRQPIELTNSEQQVSGAIESLEQPGDYLIELTVRQEGALVGVARASFQALDRDVELSNSTAGHEQMARLANATKDAGGGPLAAEQLADWVDQLRERLPQLDVEVQKKWQFGDTSLDAWLFFLIFAALLTGEWVLRKRWGLV